MRIDAGVVLTSGYSAELMNQADLAQLGLQVLRKPYRQTELARAFRAARRPLSAYELSPLS